VEIAHSNERRARVDRARAFDGAAQETRMLSLDLGQGRFTAHAMKRLEKARPHVPVHGVAHSSEQGLIHEWQRSLGGQHRIPTRHTNAGRLG